MQVTKHFKLSEFACKDGTQVPEKYQGYRTKEYNRRVGGASKSKHLTASAADVRLSGKSQKCRHASKNSSLRAPFPKAASECTPARTSPTTTSDSQRRDGTDRTQLNEIVTRHTNNC